jgi:hypothetical protein
MRPPGNPNLKLIATMFPLGFRKSVIISGIVALLSLSHIHGQTPVSGTITDDVTWNAAGSPYEVGNTTVAANATIRVEPGTLVQFQNFATLAVHGRMIADGAAAQKITFTSLSGATEGSAWRAIRLTNNDGNGNALASSSFSHCIFEGGGDWHNTMLDVATGASATVDQCVFRHSVTTGMRISTGSSAPISNTRFENNAGSGLWLLGNSPTVDSCTFSSNGNIARLDSQGGQGSFPVFTNTAFRNSGYAHIVTNIESSGTLTAAPYYMEGHRIAVSDASITIQAGATFSMANFATWTVHGNLIANGTEAAPILFTSASGINNESSPWRALRFTNAEGSGSGLPASRLSHCVFEGGGDWYGAMLEASGSAPVSLDSCVFRYSITDGAKCYEHAGGAITNTRFENNAGYGLWLRGSSPQVDACVFIGNGNVSRLASGDGEGSFPAFTNTTFQDSGFVHVATSIDSSGTLTAAPYFIDDHRVAAASATITIEGGATFDMANFSTWTLHGNLIAEGTVEHPILFTSASGVGEGSPWRALRLTNHDGAGNAMASQLSHCTFEGGGDWYRAMLEASGGAPVTLDHCAFRHSVVDGVRFFASSGGGISETQFENNVGYGLWLQGSSPAVDHCSFSGNGNACRLASGDDMASFPTFTNTTFHGENKVHIASNIASGGRFTAAPYYIDEHRVSVAKATITIDAGTSFAMKDFATWTIHGNLVAEGNASAPILFTSATGLDEGGRWRALRLTNNEGDGSGKANILTHCIFQGGGDWYGTQLETYGGAPISLDHCIFRDGIVDGAHLNDTPSSAITNCTFEDVASYGLRLQSTSPMITDNTFQRCGSQAILLLSGDSYPTFSNNTFGPNDQVEIGANLEVSGHLSNPGQAYFITGEKAILSGADVSIAPGTTLEFADFSGLSVSGSLSAQGTSTQPITLTSDDAIKEPGQWRALTFSADRTQTSLLSHCTVEAGGEWRATLIAADGTAPVQINQCTLRKGFGDGIRILADTDTSLTKTTIYECTGHGVKVDKANTVIDSCHIHNNGGSGIYATSAPAQIKGTRLGDNGQTGLWATGDSLPTISDSSLVGNATHGVNNRSSIDLLARNNWWGNATGPHHPITNPTGFGDAVSDHVLFDPYRTSGDVEPNDPYQGWLTEYFTAAEIAEGNLTTPDADPDADGLSNNEEFAFVTNPRTSDTPSLKTSFTDGRFSVDYWRRKSGYTYGVQGSADLIDWQRVANVIETILTSANGTERVRATLIIQPGHLILRVQAAR